MSKSCTLTYRLLTKWKRKKHIPGKVVSYVVYVNFILLNNFIRTVNHVVSSLSLIFEPCKTFFELFFLIFSEVVCQFCKETLPGSTDNIVFHTKSCTAVHRPDKSYKYVCPFCHYKTYRSDNIESHIRKHIGDKPYKCLYCSYRCIQSHSLKYHVLNKHPFKFQVDFGRSN